MDPLNLDPRLEQTNPFDVIPKELWKLIFFQLNTPDWSSASLVNKLWNGRIVEVVRDKMADQVDEIHKICCKYLCEQNRAYISLENNEIKEAKDSMELAARLRNFKMHFIENLANLEADKIVEFAKEYSLLKKPPYFGDLALESIRFKFKYLDKATQSYALWSLAEDLRKGGQLGLALGVADSISDGSIRSYPLKALVKDLGAAKQFTQAIELANRIPNNSTKSFALWNLATDLKNDSQFGEAIEMVNCIPNDILKSLAFKDLAFDRGA